jgi:hypothetical protein
MWCNFWFIVTLRCNCHVGWLVRVGTSYMLHSAAGSVNASMLACTRRHTLQCCWASSYHSCAACQTASLVLGLLLLVCL